MPAPSIALLDAPPPRRTEFGDRIGLMLSIGMIATGAVLRAAMAGNVACQDARREMLPLLQKLREKGRP